MENNQKNPTSTNNNSTPTTPQQHPPRTEQDNTQQPMGNNPNPNPNPEGSSQRRVELEMVMELPILKTPEEVLAELTAGVDENIGGGSGDANQDGGATQGGGSMAAAVAVTADGANTTVLVGGSGVGGADQVHSVKKRKNNQVKDPPAGTPTCPECKRQFSTWKAAFGHMRKHPERAHRGFFPPPTFSTSPSPTVNVARNQGAGGRGNIGGGGGIAAIARELVFDLNQSIATAVGSSGNAAAGGSGVANLAAPAPNANEEGRMRGFDLNELPPAEDEDEQEEK